MLTLSLQLVAIFVCCLGVGITFLPFVSRESPPLLKLLFTFTGGLFLTVLIPQNLFYVGVPVRISAWLMLGLAIFQFIRKRRELAKWARISRSNADMQGLILVLIAAVTFHSVVPIQQGLDSYYGKAHPDQINYVLLAEFLKEEPYNTRDVGYKPWLLRPFSLKEERIGQSIVTAEISEFSLTNAKTGYAATYIFFLVALALCLYALLREIGTNRVVAGFGAFLSTILPAITRLTLDGFLSQTAALFLFPFFACLLHRKEWNSRSFILFFSLGLAYLISAYTEMAPFGAASFLLGVVLVRRDKFRHKRLMVLSAILIVALLNPFYIYNLIAFLSQQYSIASKGRFMDELVTNPLSLRGWSEALFGTVDPKWIIFFEFCGVLFLLLAVGGFIALKRSEKIVLSCVLLPVIVAISLLAIRSPVPVYPIAKLIFSFSPFLCGLVSYAISQFGPAHGDLRFGAAKILSIVIFLAVASYGSIKEYGAVADNTEPLVSLRDPRFLDVCRRLEDITNEKVLLFEEDRFLLAWLCYHARKADIYCNASAIGEVPIVNQSFAFLKIPPLDVIDLFVSRDRIVDARSDVATCLTLIDNPQGVDRENGRAAYWLGPPAHIRLLARHTISGNLKMKLTPGPDAKTRPLHFLLRCGQENVLQGDIYGESTEIRRIKIPQGFSDFELTLSAERVQKQPGVLELRIARLDDLQVSDLELVAQ